jgi:NitT/TauT family transport system substrate-binding protein
MRLQRVFTVIFIFVLGYFILRGCILAVRTSSDSVFTECNDPSLPTLDIYTHGTVTTPQLALFAAISQGEACRLFNFRIHLWRNPDELLACVLTGKGDLWIGHTEGFAMARKRSAPVQILAFTSYRKFFIITSGKARDWKDSVSETVAYSPPGSPAVPLMETIMKKRSLRFMSEPHEARELSLLMSSGKIKTAILPEPLVSMLLSRNKNFSVIACVEDLFVKETGYNGILPVAAIAVNEITGRKYRESMAKLQELIILQGRKILSEGEKASKYFPSYLEEYMPGNIVSESLKRDKPLARRNDELRDDLMAYLRIVHPGLFTGNNPIDMDGNFIWR